MTEAFMDAVDSLNGLAEAMESMDNDEVRLMGLLICDLAACISQEESPVGWRAQMNVARLQ